MTVFTVSNLLGRGLNVKSGTFYSPTSDITLTDSYITQVDFNTWFIFEEYEFGLVDFSGYIDWLYGTTYLLTDFVVWDYLDRATVTVTNLNLRFDLTDDFSSGTLFSNMGTGDDTFFLNDYKDKIDAGRGNDLVYAGGGGDIIRGQAGNDYLNGQGGNDRLIGGGGKDNLIGAGGKDFLKGGGGNDILNGGGKVDRLEGGKGADKLTGGAAKDYFIFGKRDGIDVITDFDQSKDLIIIKSGASNFSQLTVSQSGFDAVVAFANTTIILEDTNAAQVDAGDFIFT